MGMMMRMNRRQDRRDPGPNNNNHTVAKTVAVVAVAKPGRVGGVGRGPSIGRRPGLG